MIERFTQGKLTWVSLKNPTAEEVQTVMVEEDIPPGLVSDFTTTVPKSGALCVDGIVKMTMDFPVVKRIDVAHPYEVKFLVTKKLLVTVQYEEMEAIDRFKKQFEVVATLNRTSKHTTGVHLFIGLLNELYESCSSKLDYVESLLADIESEIFKDNERQMVVQIAKVSKKLITFRHTLRSHEDVLRTARSLFEEHFDHVFQRELETINSHYLLLLGRSNSLFETLKALHDTNSAMLNTKQNEVMKVLTIMAFITFPLTLFSSLFGMNTSSTPIIGVPGDFWIIVSVMSVATVGFFTFFKHKHWM